MTACSKNERRRYEIAAPATARLRREHPRQRGAGIDPYT
jgi:hypothetical protein